MEGEKYLSEERYQQNNQKVKKVGKILLIVGIIILVIAIALTILGAVNMGNSMFSDSSDFNSIGKSVFGNFGIVALGGFFIFIGFGATMAGAITMIIAHRREIISYTTQQVMPVAQEGIERITPTVANAAGTIAKSVKEGINKANKK